MTLYRKENGAFTLMSDADEASVRAQVVANYSTGPILYVDSGNECIMSDDQAAAFRAERTAAANAPVPVPESVTPRQGRLALLQTGHLDAVNAAVAGADQATQLTWDYATEVRRDNPLLVAIAAGLGMSSTDLDNLFRLADTL